MDKKHKLLGKFDKIFDENSNETLNFIIIIGKFVTKNRAFGHTIFLNPPVGVKCHLKFLSGVERPLMTFPSEITTIGVSCWAHRPFGIDKRCDLLENELPQINLNFLFSDVYVKLRADPSRI